MAQGTVSRCFCVQCGAPITDEQHSCPQCEKAIDARYQQLKRQQDVANEDATVRFAVQHMPRWLTTEDDTEEDAAATMRAPARFSSHLYIQAAQQEALAAPDPQPLPAVEPLAPHDHPPLASTKKLRKRAPKKPLALIGCGIGLLVMLSLLVLGIVDVRANAPAAQQADQNEAALNQRILQARALGVPAALLQPVLQQEQQLDRSNTVFMHLSTSSAYQNLAQRYHTLSTRIPGVIAAASEQAQARAQQDVENFQVDLSRQLVQGTGNPRIFSQQFSQDQLALATANTPKAFASISQNARASILSLSAMINTQSQLADFNATIARLQTAGIDVTAAHTEYQNDLHQLSSATQVADFNNLSTLVDAQYQQIVVGSVRAFPYVSVTQLNELQAQVLQLKTYGLDASTYEQRFSADEAAMERAQTVLDDLVFLRQVDADIASMHDTLVQGEAHYLVKQFHQEVTSWSQAHLYFDRYDGHTYPLDSGYMQAGIGAGLDSDLASAATTADFETMVAETQNDLFNLHMLETDYNDHTPYNQVHQTDLQMLDHYKLQNKTVLMVSLVEQVLRVYQNGKLVRSFYVTTGRSKLPSLPGVWSPLERKSPMTFISGDPKGSPYWFPPTPIQYAIMYHYGGYFVHDAWWRASFGLGTQFPHHDAGGNTAYNFDGSHGCINLATSDAAWVYQHTDWNTAIVIY